MGMTQGSREEARWALSDLKLTRPVGSARRSQCHDGILEMMPRRAGSCYNCGAEALTRDHVFPKSLFTSPRPDPLPTVPACRACQDLTQHDEEYFRTFVAGGSYGHETGRALWEGTIRRSFDRDPAQRRALADAIRRMDLESPSGLYLGTMAGVDGDQERIGRVLRKIVRGLYYDKTGGSVMPTDLKWRFEQVSLLSTPLPDVALDLIRGMPLQRVGDEVRYKMGFTPKDPRLTISWMAFYDTMMFVVWTLPEGGTSLETDAGERGRDSPDN